MLRVAVGDPSYQIKTGDVGVEWLRIPNYPTITTDGNARTWMTSNVDFYRQSASEYLKNPIEGAVFVIFGVTAEGVVNPVPTAKGMMYPHEVQANVLHHLLNGTSPSQPVWAQTAELVAGLLLILLLLSTASNVFLSFPVLIVSFITIYYGTLNQFTQGYLLDMSGILVIGFLYWSFVTFRSFIEQFFLRRQIKQQFGTYVSPDLVKQLQKDPSLLVLGGETKEMTYLFSDIRGFTPISEKYQKDPQGLTRLVNRFLDNQTKVILKHGGTIDKYMGDCIMAFWGAPLEEPEHKEKALAAAIEMRTALEELNEDLKVQGISIQTGTGINTGLCVVGNFGSSERFDYSVIGDSVNLAARLESACKDYDSSLIISEYSLVNNPWLQYRYLDEVTVKGKSEPVKIYTI
jgi:adenylate cyclase